MVWWAFSFHCWVWVVWLVLTPDPFIAEYLVPHGHSGVITYNEYADAFYGMVHGCSCTQPSSLLLFALGRNMWWCRGGGGGSCTVCGVRCSSLTPLRIHVQVIFSTTHVRVMERSA